jgi:hypothetical protein
MGPTKPQPRGQNTAIYPLLGGPFSLVAPPPHFPPCRAFHLLVDAILPGPLRQHMAVRGAAELPFSSRVVNGDYFPLEEKVPISYLPMAPVTGSDRGVHLLRTTGGRSTSEARKTPSSSSMPLLDAGLLDRSWEAPRTGRPGSAARSGAVLNRLLPRSLFLW